MSISSSLIQTLARKFLFSKNTDGFVSFISGVSVLGVGLGVLALIVVTSVINGFEGELARAITSLNGDVLLYTRGTPVLNDGKVEDKINQILNKKIKATTHSFVTELMIAGPQGVSGSLLEGVDLASMDEVVSLKNRFLEGTLPLQSGEIALGSALADKVGVKVGSEIKLIVPFVDKEEGSDEYAPKSYVVKVSGIFKVGMYQYDSKYSIMKIDEVQNFLDQKDRVTTFKLKLNEQESAQAAASQLTAHFGYPFKAKDWGQLNKNLFYAIALEKIIIAIILAAIIIVAAFNVMSTLMMMIHDKGKEIAILKAMGFSRKKTFSLFCLLGTTIGLVGSVTGLIFGLGMNGLLRRMHLMILPEDIYYISFLPVVIRWKEVGLIVILGVLICYFATLYPAVQIAKKSPLDGLRYE